MHKIVSLIVGTSITLAGFSGAPAGAYPGPCTPAWDLSTTHWEVRYDCEGSSDSRATRRVKNSRPYYPAVIRGKAGPRQTFRLQVTPPDFRGLWHFTGRIGKRRVTRGSVTTASARKSGVWWYHVSSGMNLKSKRLNCIISGKPDTVGWNSVPRFNRKEWNSPKTWPACMATTVIMFDLVMKPHIDRRPPSDFVGKSLR